MYDLDGNDNNYNNNNGYNSNGYDNNGCNNGYNNGYNNNGGYIDNSYGGNNGCNNNYNNNGYNNSGYDNNYNNGYNNNYNNNNYNNSYTPTGTSSVSTPARSSNRGNSKFLLVIFAVAAVLFLLATFGTEVGKIKNCKSRTTGTVVSVTQTRRRVRKKNRTTYKYEYKAKIAYKVGDEQFILDVPKSTTRFTEGASETVYYNEAFPSESYSDRYMDHKKTNAIATIALMAVVGVIVIVSPNKRRT